MKKIVFLFFSTLFSVFAQKDNQLDSLNLILKQLPPEGNSFESDTARINKICSFVERKSLTSTDGLFFVLNSATKLAEQVSYQQGVLRCYILLSKYYLSQPLRSIQYLSKALALSEKLKSSKDMIEITELIGYAYSEIGEIQNSNKYYLLHASLAKKYGMQERYLLGLNSVAVSYFDTKEYDKMMNLLERCRRENQQLKSPKIESAYLINSAKVYNEQKKYDLALENLKKATLVDDGYRDKKAYILNEIAQIFLRKNKPKEALENAITALNNSPGNYTNGFITKTIVEIYKKLGRNDLALPYLERYIEAKFYQDSVKNSQLNRLLMVDYEKEKKNEELEVMNLKNERAEVQNKILIIFLISAACGILFFIYFNRLLRKKNREIEIQKTKIEDFNRNLEMMVAQRTKELSDANEELKRLSNEIIEALFKGKKAERKMVASQVHDNLGSILTSLNWLIATLNISSFSKDDMKIYNNVVMLAKKAYETARDLSHNLLPKELEEQGLIGALTTWLEGINKSNKISFNLNVYGSFEKMNSNITFEIYSICMELVTNILKHSKATEATIRLLRNDSMFQIEAIDNGMGFSESTIRKGMGLKNIKERIDSLSSIAKFEVDNKNGGRVSITIPYH